jgi:hypothetical protein
MSLENVTSSLTLDMRIRNAGKRNRPTGDEKKLDENREAGGRPLLNRSCVDIREAHLVRRETPCSAPIVVLEAPC